MLVSGSASTAAQHVDASRSRKSKIKETTAHAPMPALTQYCGVSVEQSLMDCRAASWGGSCFAYKSPICIRRWRTNQCCCQASSRDQAYLSPGKPSLSIVSITSCVTCFCAACIKQFAHSGHMYAKWEQGISSQSHGSGFKPALPTVDEQGT